MTARPPAHKPTGEDISALLEAAIDAYRVLEVLAPEEDATDRLANAINRVLFEQPEPNDAA